MTRPLEAIVNRLCEERIGRRPDLENPRGYNDLVQWLKLHDQSSAHIIACDKWAVRLMVAMEAGPEHLIPAELGVQASMAPALLKCTHDSGGTRRFEQASRADDAHLVLMHRLARPYGVEKGEWAYQFVPARLMTERALTGPIVDYKFHCAHGKVRWVQIISDRACGRPKETILSPDGALLPMHMDHKMIHHPEAGMFPGDQAWTALTALARKLASPWRYVRVDLYWADDAAWFGELTFWPLSGCYKTKDEPAFGEMLELDLTARLEPIVP